MRSAIPVSAGSAAILPMTVIRRFDAVLEPRKDALPATKKSVDAAGVVNRDSALRHSAGQDVWNTSSFALRGVGAREMRPAMGLGGETRAPTEGRRGLDPGGEPTVSGPGSSL